ncbi:MAG: alanine dehydrogenase, partial [Chloroflexi bacterium]|nr:alanine dehydrogenase [Chloroflexota bacterium]
MIVGTVREIKDRESRVALTPPGVSELVHAAHDVLVQSGAGVGSGFADAEYAAAGANILPTADEVWQRAGLMAKVKEPLPSEYAFLHESQLLFTYLHLAAEETLTQ